MLHASQIALHDLQVSNHGTSDIPPLCHSGRQQTAQASTPAAGLRPRATPNPRPQAPLGGAPKAVRTCWPDSHQTRRRRDSRSSGRATRTVHEAAASDALDDGTATAFFIVLGIVHLLMTIATRFIRESKEPPRRRNHAAQPTPKR